MPTATNGSRAKTLRRSGALLALARALWNRRRSGRRAEFIPPAPPRLLDDQEGLYRSPDVDRVASLADVG